MKNRIRKMVCILLSAMLVMSLAGCGGSGSQSSGAQQESTEEAAEPAEATEPAEAAPTEEAPAETPAEQEPAAEPAPEAAADDWSVTEVKNVDYVVSVPDKFVDLLVIETPQDDENGILFNFYEKESQEAAAKQGLDYDGAGWLFGFSVVTEEKAKELADNDIPGANVFAKDEAGNYFVYNHPTDVRVIREENTYSEETMKGWEILNTWAMTARGDFLLANEGLTPVDLSSFAEMDLVNGLQQYFMAVADIQQGTAGSSLSIANGAQRVVYQAAYSNINNADHEMLRSKMLEIWEGLGDEQRAAFDASFMDVVTLLDSCRSDWTGNRAAFDDAGCGENMEILIHSPSAMEAWETLKANTLTMGNSED